MSGFKDEANHLAGENKKAMMAYKHRLTYHYFMSIIIKTELPDLNTIIALRGQRGHGFAYGRMKKKVQEAIGWELKAQPKPKFHFPQDFIFRWYCKNKKKDKDNISSGGRKMIFDTMVNIGFLPNDGWKEIGDWEDEFLIDTENPRLEIVLVDHL